MTDYLENLNLMEKEKLYIRMEELLKDNGKETITKRFPSFILDLFLSFNIFKSSL